MNQEEKTKKAIQQENLKTTILRNSSIEISTLLNDKELNIDLNKITISYAILELAFYYKDLNPLKLFIKDKRFKPTSHNNYIIRKAAEQGQIDVLNLLLENKSINPADESNQAIIYADNTNQYEVVDLLWTNQYVKKTLKKDDPTLYKKLIQQDIPEKVRNF
jgi:hypothetical protein